MEELIQWFTGEDIEMYIPVDNEYVVDGTTTQVVPLDNMGHVHVYDGLPYTETRTETVYKLNPAYVNSVIIVVLTFVTCVTMLRHALFRR